ncbi:DUF5686 and carboxypeptidase regulatory-like domain-containing protein [Flavimarina sp. Hel_I_48]|uniref:DUF5686 and carboxypeptidase regulatory-like domain-containing protein n=1 Tax=Flavimarina sp. Hel_I_48 TaxID=1392488 RepID=UPI0004DF97C9|nr:DUF5686 and carboxypeptidase regulatory-like domain-containing protein [Flavimarina sp. Hel_I_48]
MLKNILLFFIFVFPILASAQIIGKITNTQGEGLPFVNIYIKDSQRGTTSNAEGNYQLAVEKADSYEIVFQFLGYSTKTVQVAPGKFPYELNITLTEEATSLDEVVVDARINPADRIIQAVIANKSKVLERQNAYTADFYSRGLWKVQNAPKSILGQEIDLGSGLDSTRSGIIYLSETISTISYRAPDDFKEKITASKVSGDDQGFSFNSAQEAEYSFYENTIDLNAALVSPIAEYAFTYYKFKLVGTFYENAKLINKIEVLPKRENDRVFTGFIYVVEDDWQLYGAELTTTGNAIQVPFIETLVFKHNFIYNKEENVWVKRSQTIDFSFKMFGFGGDGRFTAVYENYDFQPDFGKKSFTNEVLAFAEGANKKDSLYWENVRPVPLTSEEQNDYVVKDSLQIVEHSKAYMDSVDAGHNAFKLLDPLLGYTYENSYDRWRFSVGSPLFNLRFNTLQGWNSAVDLNYSSWTENYESSFNANLKANYGLSDERLRFMGGISKRYDRITRRTLWLQGGQEVKQFNAQEPIPSLVNSIATLFWERNYLKAYDRSFTEIGYSEELFNGFQLYASLDYAKRQPLFNTTDYVLIKNDFEYTSNNPLAPGDFKTPALQTHELATFNLSARIHFDQKYMSYPDGKFNVGDSKYPTLDLAVEQGFGGSTGKLNFTRLGTRISQEIALGNKGSLQYSLGGGTFMHGDAISFVDYRHFNGNQTRLNLNVGSITNFNLLPYYDLSTNKSYFEGHLEHDFKGYILGKIPGIRALNLNLLAGAKLLAREVGKPYSELSLGLGNLGFGKFRFLRVDYVRSYFNGGSDGAFVFGLKF